MSKLETHRYVECDCEVKVPMTLPYEGEEDPTGISVDYFDENLMGHILGVLCKKCANNCPAQAIPFGEKTEENGTLKWVLNREGCYKFWRKAGTDCAKCLYVCPYSKPQNWFHNSLRKLISQSSTAQRISLWADDYFYGSNPLPKAPPF